MAIRRKAIDQQVRSMKQFSTVIVGDIAAGTVTPPIFTAPYACKVENVEVMSTTGVSANSSETVVFTVRHTTASANIIGIRGATASGANSNNIVAAAPYVITASDNNSLSRGTTISLNISAVCSVMSRVMVTTVYTWRPHAEDR